MFRNVLLITLRNMRRYKLYSAINIAGLAVGIACCLMIGLLIEDELRYDRFHRYADRIYRLSTWNNAYTNGHLGPRLAADFPEIEQVVRLAHVSSAGTPMAYLNREFLEEELLYATPNFFNVFSFRLLKGDLGTALESPDAIVISQEMAKRYFGADDAIGKSLIINSGYLDERAVQVTGILYNVPRHSHFPFQGLVPYSANSWGERESAIAYTYLLLDESAKARELVNKIRDWLPHQYTSNAPEGESASQRGRTTRPFRLTPLEDIHLHSQLDHELGPNRDIIELYLLGSIGILVLLIACANYMNLATARSVNRGREVGLRKVVGADRRQLIRQFLGEAVIVTFLAFTVSVMLTEMFLPFLNAAVGRSLSITYGGRFLCILGAAALVVGILAGSYPALFLSHFSPSSMLKDLSTGTHRSAEFRQVLVILQFAISIGLIGTTAVALRQLHFMNKKNLGFEKRDVVVLDAGEISAIGTPAEHRIQTIKDELTRNPNILNVSIASSLPGQNYWITNEFTLIDSPASKPLGFKTTCVDRDYLETMGIDLIAGRNLTLNFATMTNDEVILNESAARAMGIGKTTGQRVRMNLWGDLITTGTIVGIVRDFHIRSLHHRVEPTALRPNLGKIGLINAYELVVKTRPGAVLAALPFLREKFAELAPSRYFRYRLLDSYLDFDQLYRNETRLMKVFGAFSGLAIFVAFLGLFGLASFTAERRTKKIGIRRVLGASAFSVVALLSKDFVKLVIIAILIAWPVAHYAADSWLQNFAYRVDVGWWTFALAGALALGIALLTVSWQAARAARTNPADVLRQE